jgi:hypothetical protein
VIEIIGRNAFLDLAIYVTHTKINKNEKAHRQIDKIMAVHTKHFPFLLAFFKI